MVAHPSALRDERPADITSPAGRSRREARFNRRLHESAWLQHMCGFDISLFDAVSSVEGNALTA